MVDIKGAFNAVLLGRLLRRLRAQGWPDNIARWAYSFATGRTARVRLDETTLPAEAVSCGLPQGSPVSPILFMLFASPLYQLVGASRRNRYGYADDMALRATSLSAEDNAKQLSASLKALLAWGIAEGITIDPDKCELIHFYRGREAPTAGILLLEEGFSIQPIEKGQSLRWLGVFFDSQLRLKEHIKRAASRALTVAKALKALGNTHKGMAPHLMRQAAMACVYGTAAFAAETWWQGPEAKGYTGPIKALDRAFATAARAIAPAYATVPIAALFREAGIHRAKPFLESARRKAAARLFRLDIDHPLAQRIFKPLTISTRLTRLAALAPPATTRADPLAYAPWQLHNKANLAAEARGPFLPAGPKDLIAYTSGALEAKTEAAEAAAGTGCALYRQGQEVATSSLPYPPTASPLDLATLAIAAALYLAAHPTVRGDCRQVIVVSDNREAISNTASTKPPALTLYHTLTRVRHWEQKIGVPVRYR